MAQIEDPVGVEVVELRLRAGVPTLGGFDEKLGSGLLRVAHAAAERPADLSTATSHGVASRLDDELPHVGRALSHAGCGPEGLGQARTLPAGNVG